MPPRAVKRTPGPGPKRGGKVAKKAPNPPPASDESRAAVKDLPPEKVEEPQAKAELVKVEDAPPPAPVAEVKEVVEIVEVEDEEEVVEAQEEVDGKPESDANSAVDGKKEDDVKESVEEYEKDERLDLDDNDYEPEEYGAVDYDEKELEQEDLQEGDEEIEEEEEGDVGEEEDGEMVEEEMEEAPEEAEGEEDEGQATEEHAAEGQAEMADAEEEEHHEVFKERRKRKEFEIFIGGLDKDATEEDLKKVFGKVGEVSEVRLMKNPQTKKNKGFAFLRFATVEQAKRAVTELKNPLVNGKQCGVTPSQDSDTLFLGNICKTWTKEALKDKLNHYGVENIDDLTLVEDSNNEGMNRGFAFLEFSSRSDAMDAYKRLLKKGVVFGVDRAAKVSFADSFIDPGDEIMAQVKTVFIDGLPASWDEDRVREHLKRYGAIQKIELARNMPSAKRKDFGFVSFDSHEAAVTCAKGINNAELGEGDNKAKVRARLSRPLQRGKGKHVSRVDHRASRRAGNRPGNRPGLRPAHVPGKGGRGPWVRPIPRSLPSRGARVIGARIPPTIDRGVRRTVPARERRPPVAMPIRTRPSAPTSRSFDRRLPVPSYLKSGMKRDYGRREELPPPRSRAAADYSSRVIPERRSSHRDQYAAARGSGYSDLPRSTSRTVARRNYVDDGYGQRFDRPTPPGYRDGRPRDYEPISGSKRPYTSVDDVPSRFADAGSRHPRTRYDYDIGGSGSQYGDTYSDRLGRSNLGYGSSRSSISSQDPHGLYSRQEMGYAGGSLSGGDGGGIYSSTFSSDYVSRGTNVGSGSYSSFYSSRSLGGSSYMGGGGSGSYY